MFEIILRVFFKDMDTELIKSVVQNITYIFSDQYNP